MTLSLEFSELPPDGRGCTDIEQLADELRRRPMSWARISTRPTVNAAAQFASALRTGRRAGFRPAGAFEVTTRGRDVWARYVADPST